MRTFLFLSVFIIGALCLKAQELAPNQVVSEAVFQKMKTSPTGLKYLMRQTGSGLKPKDGDFVLVHYTGKLENGKTFDSSYDRAEPLLFKLGAGMVIKGWDQGVAMMHKGGESTLYIPSALAYAEREIPKLIPAHSNLIFDVKLVEVLRFDTSLVEPIVTEQGLKIYKYNSTSYPSKKAITKVTAHYKGYLPSGKQFDSSFDRMQPFSFPLGKGKVIKGWDIAFSHLRPGEYATIVVPPNLGYGANGIPGTIPPNSSLLFDVYFVK